MRMISRCVMALFACLNAPHSVFAENLTDAWSIALATNQRLQAQQAQSVSAGFTLGAARAARLPTVRNFSFESFLTATPEVKDTLLSTSALGGAAGGLSGLPGHSGFVAGGVPGANLGSLLGIPSAFPILGPGQRQLPVSVTFASIPLYTGGKILRNIDAANAQVGVQRNNEFRAVLDLKLTVAEAYVGVLRARKNLETARSNVAQLSSFSRDVKNRRQQGLAIRSDELAAEVSLANAQLTEIQARTVLEIAWATYNRYLCRPLNVVMALEEMGNVATDGDPAAAIAAASAHVGDASSGINEGEIDALSTRALLARPELAGLAEQARGLAAQAAATQAGIRPQVGFAMVYAFVGNNIQTPQGIGGATFFVDWTLTDSGATRKRAAALRQQEISAIKTRQDAAADILLQVRTRWLDLYQAHLRVPIARIAIAQAQENLKVINDRYRQQLSTYTEVLDAETRRIQSLNGFFNAVYDETLALLRLHRTVGDL